MAVAFSASITDKGASLSIGRLGKAVSAPKVAETAAHAMVHEFMPDVFYSNLYNWKRTIRPGQPLLDTGTHLASGFVYSVSGAVATIRNLFRYAHVHDKGMTITAKRAKYLRFKIRGVGWVQKKQVTIPQRRFAYWSQMARDFVMRRVQGMVRATREGRA